MTERVSTEAGAAEASAQGMKCDFCESVVASVRRVTLHGNYERLRTRHAVMYACPECFEKKDRERLGLEPGGGPG